MEDASTCYLFFFWYSPWGYFCSLRSSLRYLKMYQLTSVRPKSFSTVLHMCNLFSIIIVTSSQAVSDPHDGNVLQTSPDQSQMNCCHSWQQPDRQKLWVPEGILSVHMVCGLGIDTGSRVLAQKSHCQALLGCFNAVSQHLINEQGNSLPGDYSHWLADQVMLLP